MHEEDQKLNDQMIESLLFANPEDGKKMKRNKKKRKKKNVRKTGSNFINLPTTLLVSQVTFTISQEYNKLD